MAIYGILKAVTFLHLNHRLHSPLEKNMIERMIQYFKDRTESFDDYYPCNNNKTRNYNLSTCIQLDQIICLFIIQKSEIQFYSKLKVK